MCLQGFALVVLALRVVIMVAFFVWINWISWAGRLVDDELISLQQTTMNHVRCVPALVRTLNA